LLAAMNLRGYRNGLNKGARWFSCLLKS
jgi:hypothetical protein